MDGNSIYQNAGNSSFGNVRTDKNKKAMYKYILTVLALLVSVGGAAQRKTCIDTGWQFKYGDGSEVLRSAAASEGWRTLDLPHDWSVETDAATSVGGTVVGPFTDKSIGKHQTGFTVGGEGWYAKTLTIGATELEGQRYELYLEGAYNESEVYVNGEKAGDNVYGYISYKNDITDKLHAGANSVAVHVKNEGNNTRWYAGSGIYRHVWLIRTPLVYAEEWDTYIQPNESGVVVSTTIHNKTGKAQQAKVSVEILDKSGKKVGKSSATQTVGSDVQTAMAITVPLRQAERWSLEHPNLYTAVVKVRGSKCKRSDTLTKKFGIRSIAFSAEKGFQLNGEPTLLQGGCIHHDNGLLGAAAYDRAETRKLELLKAQGYNAIRCSHNLPSEHFLDACDSLGLLVIDEAFDQWNLKKNSEDYHRYFKTHSSADVQTMVRRDRNHPSVIMWSIGNEIPGRIEPEGLATAERLRQAIRSLDTTRPVTAAICTWDEGDEWNSKSRSWDMQDEKAFLSLDVGGYNYALNHYEHDHGTHPDRVMFGAESFPKQASENWELVERLPYVIGDFVWTAMDYLGEAGIGSSSIRNEGQQTFFQTWPWYNGWCGDIDLIGQKKPQSYYKDVVWRRCPITMAVEGYQAPGFYQSVSLWGWQVEHQCWTFPDVAEGSEMKVNVYSRSPRVRLYLNGESVGEEATNKTFCASFKVPYHAGTLKAVNIDSAGNEAADKTFTLTTTGAATGIRLTADRTQIASDGSDLSYVTIELTDDAGRVVTSDSSTKVSIHVDGAGVLLASGNANPTDMESFRNPSPRVFEGRALAIVKSNHKKGEITVSVTAEGLKAGKQTLWAK